MSESKEGAAAQGGGGNQGGGKSGNDKAGGKPAGDKAVNGKSGGDKAATEKVAAEKTATDKVGDILKRERLTRRITVETIAKDLKLNINYIKALEASDYESLPVDPYVKVYIRSLTKYLSLDTETVMQQFYKERGLIADDYKDRANKLDVSVQRQEKNPTVIIAAALIVILAVFAFVATQNGWLTPPADITEHSEEKADTSGAHDPDAALEQSDDDMIANINIPETTAAKAAKAPPRP
jgi:cytoskeletal protein RodZ